MSITLEMIDGLKLSTDEVEQKKFIDVDDRMLAYINNPSDEVVLYAVSKHFRAISAIEGLSQELLEKCLRIDGRCLISVSRQFYTERNMVLAVMSTPEVYWYLTHNDEPSDVVKAAYDMAMSRHKDFKGL